MKTTLKLCSNCSFLEDGWKHPHCKKKSAPVSFIDNPKEFGCIFFSPNEKLETCEFCDGVGAIFVDRLANGLNDWDDWVLCDKCNGEGYVEAN